MGETQATKLLLSVPETAKALGVCERTISTLTANQEIPHVRIGRRVLYPVADLQRWIDERKCGDWASSLAI